MNRIKTPRYLKITSIYLVEVDIFKPTLTLILDDLSTHYTMEQIAIVKFIRLKIWKVLFIQNKKLN